VRIGLTDKQRNAVGWLIRDLMEHEQASRELRLKMASIFDTWWDDWTGFKAEDMSVELPNLEIPDGETDSST
jgi:hypothetical protein